MRTDFRSPDPTPKPVRAPAGQLPWIDDLAQPDPGVAPARLRGHRAGGRGPGDHGTGGRGVGGSRIEPRRVRRIAAWAALIALIPALASFAVSMSQRSDSAFSIRSVEWLRANGATALVDQVESVYYSLTAPPTGGPALKHLPNQPGVAVSGSGGARHRAVVPHYEPPPIKPLLHPALSGEGVWRSTFVGAAARHRPPAVLITSFRPNPLYPQLVAGVAWIDHTETSVWLYPGIQEPAVAMADRGPEEIPPAARSRLLASFNSAFKLGDSGGGFAYDGRTYAPMVNGEATIVRQRSGKVNVIAWKDGSRVSSDIVYARQNLRLIVEGGKPNPNLSDGPEWGATLGNAVQVWRSAIGVDRHGNLIYAAANYQTVGSLAKIMIHAGAWRAMELDINAYWPSFITYRAPGAVGAANFLPGMVRSPQRYLTPDDRDFFAVYMK